MFSLISSIDSHSFTLVVWLGWYLAPRKHGSFRHDRSHDGHRASPGAEFVQYTAEQANPEPLEKWKGPSLRKARISFPLVSFDLLENVPFYKCHVFPDHLSTLVQESPRGPPCDWLPNGSTSYKCVMAFAIPTVWCLQGGKCWERWGWMETKMYWNCFVGHISLEWRVWWWR